MSQRRTDGELRAMVAAMEAELGRYSASEPIENYLVTQGYLEIFKELLELRGDVRRAKAAMKQNFEDTSCCPMCGTHDRHAVNCLLFELGGPDPC